MRLYRERAVVLRQHKLGEADRIVTLLTLEHGLVRAVAKGVRRTRSKFGARLEPGLHTELLLYEGRGELDIVNQAETLDHFRAIRDDLDRLTAMTSMLEVVDQIANEGEPNPQLFRMLLGALRTLEAHLVPSGLAVVDCWLPDAEDLARYDGRVVLEWVREEPGTGRTVTKTGSATWDPTTSTVRLTTVFEAGEPGEPAVRWVRVDNLRLVSPDELVSMAEAAGLRVEALAGDYDLGPLELGAERVVLLARRS